MVTICIYHSITSQSNGRVEKAAKHSCIKQSIDDKADVYLAYGLSKHANRSNTHASTSSSQRTGTLLPMLPVLLQTEPVAQREGPEQRKCRKEKQTRSTIGKTRRCLNLPEWPHMV